MNSQKQYPKYYSHPHYWINAIEVESIKDYPVFGQNGVTKKRVYKLTHNNFTEFIADGDLKDYAPLFKPQEGAAFIKDLEAAVSAATGKLNVKHRIYDAVSELFDVNDGEFLVEVFDVTFAMSTSDNLMFDTAAYVDKLRELGYYI